MLNCTAQAMGLLAREEPAQRAFQAEQQSAGGDAEAQLPAAALGHAEGAVSPAANSKRVTGAEPVPAFAPEVKQQLQDFWDGLRGTCQALRAVERFRVAAIAFRRCSPGCSSGHPIVSQHGAVASALSEFL